MCLPPNHSVERFDVLHLKLVKVASNVATEGQQEANEGNQSSVDSSNYYIALLALQQSLAIFFFAFKNDSCCKNSKQNCRHERAEGVADVPQVVILAPKLANSNPVVGELVDDQDGEHREGNLVLPSGLGHVFLWCS